ncbi:class I SAM-dependent methyltransferase [Methylobacillus sp. Pita2]|uniref:class I SAM-dependent methyltransferase n=1 Tax=Methylobacillus sp. Pita2 TaxID=3383245 RepID=UPI0038B47211
MNPDLGQYFTPTWAAEAILERYFPNIDAEVGIVEPSCGPGSFLSVLPSQVPVVGVEIDPALAALASQHTGRQVILGDFSQVDIPFEPSLIIGNPPFSLDVIDQFLVRAHDILLPHGRVGFILPAYALQTAGRVAEYSSRWSILSEMIPRNIFPGLSKPLVFSVFTKDTRRVLVGMALYFETHDKNRLAKPYRDALSASVGSIWKTVCKTAIKMLGGEASLQQIYGEIEGNRPTTTKFWREKIRQTLRLNPDEFKVVGNATYALVAQ